MRRSEDVGVVQPSTLEQWSMLRGALVAFRPRDGNDLGSLEALGVAADGSAQRS